MVSLVVRLLDGSNVRYENLLPGTTVLQFKQQIQDRQGILISEQKLLYAGQFLDDQRELDSYNIGEVGISGDSRFLHSGSSCCRSSQSIRGS